MNEEILKEAVNFGATIGNRWDKYTDEGRLFFLSKLFALCREAKRGGKYRHTAYGYKWSYKPINTL